MVTDADRIERLESFAAEAERHIKALGQSNAELERRNAELTQHLTSALSLLQITATAGGGARVPDPPIYSGKTGTLEPFIAAVDRKFAIESSRFATPAVRVASVLSWTEGRIRAYLTVLDQRSAQDCQIDPSASELDWPAIKSRLQEMFQERHKADLAHERLSSLVQRGSAANYAAEFYQYQIDSDHSEAALLRMFKNGLKQSVRTHLATTTHTRLDDYIAAAISADHELFHAQRNLKPSSEVPKKPPPKKQEQRSTATPPKTTSPSSNPTSNTTVVPMDLDQTKVKRGPLTEEEKQRRRSKGLCLYCASPDHIVSACPVRPTDSGKGKRQ